MELGQDSLADGVGCIPGKTTFALAGVLVAVLANSDVSRLTPANSPGVLDLPVRLPGRGLGAVADDQNSVVERGAAVAGEHTRGVQLEGHLVGLNRDGNRALGDGSLERGFAVVDVLVAGDGVVVGAA